MALSQPQTGWSLLMCCIIGIVAGNSDRCQKKVPLNSTAGNISKPLYTYSMNETGIYSCWFLSHPASGDYFTALYIEHVNFTFIDTYLGFSGINALVKSKLTPSCILYDKANCETSEAVAKMARHFPECKDSYIYIKMNDDPPKVTLSSGADGKWKKGVQQFNLQYILFTCADVTGNKSNFLPNSNVADESSSVPNRQNQETEGCSSGCGLVLTIIAVILGVLLIGTLIALAVVIRRRRVPTVSAATVGVRLTTENQLSNVVAEAEDAGENPPPEEQSHDANSASEQQTESAVYAVVVKKK